MAQRPAEVFELGAELARLIARCCVMANRAKRIVSGLILMFFAALAASAQVQVSAGASNLPILAGCEPDYPPYCIVTADQKADGFSVELLRAALKAVGREVTFRTGPWSELKQDLAVGRLQALPLVGRTPERELIYDFTFPYLTMHGAIVVRVGSKEIGGPTDLQGKRVAVLRGDNAEEYLNRAGLGAVVVPVETYEKALQELSAGQHDAVVIQKLVAYQLMSRAGLKNLITVGPPLQDFKQTFCFAVRKGDRDLLATLNEGLALVMASGTFRALHTKWFAELEALGRTRSRIVVGGDNNFPPYEFLDQNGQPAGFNVELTRAIARHAGLAVDIHLGAWSDIRAGLGTGAVDVVQGMFFSAERAEQFSFSTPHGAIQYAVVVRAGSPDLSDLKELTGKSVLVMAGDIMEDVAVKQGRLTKLVAVASQEEALRLLAEGKHDAALVAKLPARYWIERHGWRNLRVSTHPVLTPEYCYAVPQGKDAMLAALNEGLAAVKETGEFRKIQAKWLSPYDATGLDGRRLMRNIALALLPVLGVFLALVFWSRSLKRQVAKQTEALVADIAARKQAEEALAQATERLQRTAEIAKVGGWSLDLQTMELSWSLETCQIHEIDPPVAPALDQAINYYAPEARPIILAAVQAASERGTPYDLELPLITAKGRHIWVRAQCSPFVIGGKVTKLHGAFHEITERKLTEERLRKQATLLDSASDAIYVCTLDHTVTYWNAGAARLYGWSTAETVGRRVTELGLAEPAEFAAAHAALLTRGEWSGERQKTGKDGKKRVVFCRWTLLRDERGQPQEVLAINTDITDKKKLEAQFLRAQRMEGIGMLAGGVAHDLNNILTPILISTSLLHRAVHDDESRQLLDSMQASAKRGAEIIRQLLTFARGQPGVRAPVPVRQLLGETERLLRETFPRNIRLVVATPERLWPVVGDATQIHQSLMNLCVNARDAMPDGGTLTLKAGNVTLDEADAATISDAKTGPYVRLCVSDTGMGIPPAQLKHIFDPFFTTKELGKGTGLGLATVLGIIRGHGGSVQVESQMGHGTTFELYLPASPDATVVKAPEPMSELPRGHGELILVVDDEASVRNATKQVLEKSGYRVLAAAEGAEAVGLYSQRRTEIAAVLTDMMMPGMDGPTLVRALRAMEPRLPILGMTGLIERKVVKGLEELDLVPFVTKPFELEKLLVALRQILEVGAHEVRFGGVVLKKRAQE